MTPVNGEPITVGNGEEELNMIHIAHCGVGTENCDALAPGESTCRTTMDSIAGPVRSLISHGHPFVYLKTPINSGCAAAAKPRARTTAASSSVRFISASLVVVRIRGHIIPQLLVSFPLFCRKQRRAEVPSAVKTSTTRRRPKSLENEIGF